ncbi:MAG TPA: site-specific DNA-methyltransferase [Flavobacteriales bacterium]|nr:site-specific DNA-methyltransferase [Flavobacteriales bacterium]
MTKHPKLELTWIGKDQRPKLEPRILLEDPAKSYHAKQRVTDHDLFDNRLIFGDNLLALKALEQEFAGKVKCVYIDPPYNTGSAFVHYDDGLEHSIWLGFMRDRLSELRKLITDDGSIWVSIDDHEHAYLKVLMDEVFGRSNFVCSVIWQKKYAPKADSKYFSESHDYVVVYAKDLSQFAMNRIVKGEKQTSRYTNRDNDPRGPWKASDVLRNEVRDYAVFPVKLPSGREVWPSQGTSWRYTKEKFDELIADKRIWFGVNGDARPAYKRFLSEVVDTMPPTTLWPYDEVGHNDESKKESKVLFGAEVFGTPKPERLMQRIVEIATNPGDIVLDSFAGSGTTGGAAHKLGRRWIMVELGEHCHTHIIPRLKKVVDGSDQGGISKAMEWKGGGGFRYYKLAPSLLQQDKWGNWVISKQYNAAMLAEAACKLEGFAYAPSTEHYWMHGHSTERDFIYVTTQHLTAEQLQYLSDEVGPQRSLLVLCTAFKGKAERWPNLTVKKIPMAVLKRCEWNHDDYSLNVENLPVAAQPAPEPVQGQLAFDSAKPKARKATTKKRKP